MFKLFQPFGNLACGISQKGDGAIEQADIELNFRHNFKKFLKSKNIDPLNSISPLQTHSNKAAKVGEGNVGKVTTGVDGLITQSNNLFLTVTVSDCFPVYFYNPISKSIALAHSGWRGTINNLAASIIKAFDSNPADILVGIGPGIQACHFEIKEDVQGQFKSYGELISYRDEKIYVDLPKILRRQLTNNGVLDHNIEDLTECTYHQPQKYFSFRRDKPSKPQAMVAFLGIMQ